MELTFIASLTVGIIGIVQMCKRNYWPGLFFIGLAIVWMYTGVINYDPAIDLTTGDFY